MKLQFDYLQGPVLGHKRRCESLMQVARECGHQIVDDEPDWLIVDYPTSQVPAWDGYKRRLLMGTLPQVDTDYAWHPLGKPGKHTLTGIEYLILDPKLELYKKHPKRNWFFVTCGGADPLNLTPRLLRLLPTDTKVYYNCVVIGINFQHKIEIPDGWQVLYAPDSTKMLDNMAQYRTVICAWGNTAFEASYLGCRVLPIPTCVEHVSEILRFGLEPVLLDQLDLLPQKLLEPARYVSVDLLGAKRLLRALDDQT